jgi:hypothetical protein
VCAELMYSLCLLHIVYVCTVSVLYSYWLLNTQLPWLLHQQLTYNISCCQFMQSCILQTRLMLLQASYLFTEGVSIYVSTLILSRWSAECYIKTPSSYRAVNAFHLSFKKPISLCFLGRSLCFVINTKRISTVCGQNVKFVNVKLVGASRNR